MIEVKNLTKLYGKFKAVDDVSLCAADGEVTILLGPNGAGKSTTIKSITNLLQYQRCCQQLTGCEKGLWLYPRGTGAL